MPRTSPMSLGELVICENFLDGHREYAIDLLSNIKNFAQWHPNGPEGCPQSRNGQTCTLCALCRADGLMGATKTALETYDDTDRRLKTVRASLGKSLPSRAAPDRETLFRNSLAKVLFVAIVTAGDVLQLEHAKWQTRLRDELASVMSSSSQPTEFDTRVVDLLLPTYTGPKVIIPGANPKFSAGSVGESPSESSMFIAFRRCLSADCPCGLNKGNSTTNDTLGGLQVAPKVHVSATNAKKTRSSKRTAESRKTGDSANAPAKEKTKAQTENSSTYHDPNSPAAGLPGMPTLQDGSLHEHLLSSSTSNTALWTQGTESPSPECDSLIIDPRVFRLREEIVRSDDARRALIAWCRTWMTDLDRTRPETSLTCVSIAKDPSTLTPGCGMNIVEPGKSPRTTGHIGATTKDLSHSDDATTAQELRFDEQEELRDRWLTARHKRPKDRKRRPRGRLNLH